MTMLQVSTWHISEREYADGKVLTEVWAYKRGVPVRYTSELYTPNATERLCRGMRWMGIGRESERNN